MLRPRFDSLQRGALFATAGLFSAGYATIGLLLILASVVAEGLARRRLPWRRGPLDAFLGAFIGVFLLSGWVSSYRPIALAAAGLTALTIYLAYGPLQRVIARDRTFPIPLLAVWCLGGVGAAIWTIVTSRRVNDAGFTAALGQNAVGTTLLVTLLLLLGTFLISRRGWRVPAAIAIAIVTWGLLATYTRGAWVGAVVGIVAFGTMLRSRGVARVLLLVLLVGVVGVAVAGRDQALLLRRVRSTIDIRFNEDRILLSKAALAIFRDHPVLGTGLDTFHLVYRYYRLPGDRNPDDQPFAHNVFVNMAAEGGLLGFGTFAALLAAAAVKGWRWHIGSRFTTEGVISAAVLSAFVGMLVHQLFDGTILSVHLGAGLWFLMAILTAPYERAGSTPV